MKERVVVAMSGGVDSSVAASVLLTQGHEVIGLTMSLFDPPGRKCEQEAGRSCCGWQAVEDAHRVARSLGISHFVVDLKREFQKSVVDDFCREYGSGRTPNPCVRCNEHVKFRALLQRAKRLGAKFIATGHYARVQFDGLTGRFRLLKGLDKTKDQSYFLYPLTQGQLAASLFPVGGMTKARVRSAARKLKLPVAEKLESQEICFVPDRDYARFVAERCPEKAAPGPILDSRSRQLGTHKGLIHFTIGQRRGLGIAAPHPLYVLELDAARNAVVVGPSEGLYKRTLVARSLNFVSGEKLAGPTALRARIRYRHAEAEALVVPQGRDAVRVEFVKPQRAITPGQSVVFYDGESVVGGGTIDRVVE